MHDWKRQHMTHAKHARSSQDLLLPRRTDTSVVPAPQGEPPPHRYLSAFGCAWICSLLGSNLAIAGVSSPHCAPLMNRERTTLAIDYGELVLAPATTSYEPRFGASLSTSARWLAVGAPMDHDDGNASGSVHLYSVERNAHGSVTAAEIARSDSPVGGDRFAAALVIRFGETPSPELLVGCDTSDELLPDAGCVRMFQLNEARLDAASVLFSPRPEPGEAFGHAIAANGNCIVIGAPRGDTVLVQSDIDGSFHSTQIYDAGHAYIFSRSPQSGAWYASATLDREAPEASAWFGRAVCANEEWIAIGAPGVDALADDGGTAIAMTVGEVSVYHRALTGGWKLHTTLRPPRIAEFAAFGSALALEGSTLVVGAPGYTDSMSEPGRNSAVGAVFAYALSDAAIGSPVSLTAPDGGASSSFGLSVALSRGQLLIGAPGANDAGQSSGAAWLFARRGAEDPFLPVARLRAAEAGEMFLLGSASALMDHCAVVGRFHDEESGHTRGSVHLFSTEPPLIAHAEAPSSSSRDEEHRTEAAP